jgi:hypothetical protein
VIGALVIAFILLVFIPVSVMMTGGAVAGILGYFLKEDVDEEYEGTEHISIS